MTYGRQVLQSGANALREATGNDEYDGLGAAVTEGISLKEWLWLSDAEKARFLMNVTEPEAFDDGI